jgi:two-component system, LytTR family, sensor kinase
LQRSALEREWSAARLAALRMQLSPHTLFNLLHTIRGHIEWDPKAPRPWSCSSRICCAGC